MTKPKRDPRPTIDHETLQRYVAEGLTLTQMTERWYEETGTHRTRAAFAAAMNRRKIESPHPKVRHPDELPWHIINKHQMAGEARHLRALGRRNKTLPNTEDVNRRLDSWLRWMDENNAVVHYDPETAQGFWLVPREPSDGDGYVRKPEGSAKDS